MTTGDQRWLLAIDSSSETASLALSNGTQVAEVTWHAGRDQTVTLLGEVDRLFALMRTEPTALCAVAVAAGPGMFNGLRVGMSIAKGFVLALDLPLIGVSTLDVAASSFVGVGLPVIATVTAGRGRLVWARYGADQPLTQTSSPQNSTVDELALVIGNAGDCLIAGELTTEQEAHLVQYANIRIPARATRLRRAASLAEIAWERFWTNDLSDAVELEPVYLHSTTAANTQPGATQS